MNAGDYRRRGGLKGRAGVGGCCNYPLLLVVFPVASLQLLLVFVFSGLLKQSAHTIATSRCVTETRATVKDRFPVCVWGPCRFCRPLLVVRGRRRSCRKKNQPCTINHAETVNGQVRGSKVIRLNS